MGTRQLGSTVAIAFRSATATAAAATTDNTTGKVSTRSRKAKATSVQPAVVTLAAAAATTTTTTTTATTVMTRRTRSAAAIAAAAAAAVAATSDATAAKTAKSRAALARKSAAAPKEALTRSARSRATKSSARVTTSAKQENTPSTNSSSRLSPLVSGRARSKRPLATSEPSLPACLPSNVSTSPPLLSSSEKLQQDLPPRPSSSKAATLAKKPSAPSSPAKKRKTIPTQPTLIVNSNDTVLSPTTTTIADPAVAPASKSSQFPPALPNPDLITSSPKRPPPSTSSAFSPNARLFKRRRLLLSSRNSPASGSRSNDSAISLYSMNSPRRPIKSIVAGECPNIYNNNDDDGGDGDGDNDVLLPMSPNAHKPSPIQREDTVSTIYNAENDDEMIAEHTSSGNKTDGEVESSSLKSIFSPVFNLIKKVSSSDSDKGHDTGAQQQQQQQQWDTTTGTMDIAAATSDTTSVGGNPGGPYSMVASPDERHYSYNATSTTTTSNSDSNDSGDFVASVANSVNLVAAGSYQQQQQQQQQQQDIAGWDMAQYGMNGYSAVSFSDEYMSSMLASSLAFSNTATPSSSSSSLSFPNHQNNLGTATTPSAMASSESDPQQHAPQIDAAAVLSPPPHPAPTSTLVRSNANRALALDHRMPELYQCKSSVEEEEAGSEKLANDNNNNDNDSLYDLDCDEDVDAYILMASLPPIPKHHIQRPFALPRKTRSSPPITLVLDLDETLVHCSLSEITNPDLVFPVEFDGNTFQVHCLLRPKYREFLERASQLFEVVLFTASQQAYADKLMNRIDPQRKLVRYRLFRDSCVNVCENYIKDLSILGRDPGKVVIVDNTPQAFGYQLSNGIPIKSWYNDRSDNELMRVMAFLETLVGQDDVRPLVESRFKTRCKVERFQSMGYTFAFFQHHSSQEADPSAATADSTPAASTASTATTESTDDTSTSTSTSTSDDSDDYITNAYQAPGRTVSIPTTTVVATASSSSMTPSASL